MAEQNPFLVPSSNSDQAGGTFDPAGRSVEAGRGIEWLKQGWQLFAKNPGMWIAIAVILAVIAIVLSLIPVLGNLALNFLMPVFVGGILLGCRSLSEGGEFGIDTLFAGFKRNTTNLILVGVFYLIGVAIVVGIVFLIGGGAALTGFDAWNFATVLQPGIVGTDPFDGQVDVYPFGGINIYFASPMNEDTFEGKITIEPEPWRAPGFFYYSYDSSLNLSFPQEPSTDYTITIAPGMEDVYGNRIERQFVLRYTTARYDPDVTLQVPGGVGFYNAYNEQTQLFLTHRNVSSIELSLYAVGTNAFINTLNNYSYDPASNYSPSQADLLRSWEIVSTTPENQTRYELLELGSTGDTGSPIPSTVDCPGAMPSRLKAGDSAIVITDPDPIRARSAPVEGDVVTQLYRDYQLPIVGGPECANSIVWWQVQLRDQTTAWVAEGAEGEYYLDLLAAGAATPVTIPQG
ncbi:MAG: Ig-like domain-containing protein, partial [Anaerolineae bacterium]|nr:Ig-like domain-containing protein [Anaerolineae bacterium]